MPSNKTAYADMLLHVRKKSCLQWPNFTPNIFHCFGSYSRIGHLETQLSLAIANKTTGEVQEKWAYSPYISISDSAVGPKDLLPIRVNRSVFAEGIESVTGQPHEFQNSEHRQTLIQDAVELMHGLAGHKHRENAHPRRRLLLINLKTTLRWVIRVLNSLYWWTRTTTVSISILGTVLRAGSKAIKIPPTVVYTTSLRTLSLHQSFHQILMASWTIVFVTFGLALPSFLMMKTVFRIRTKPRSGAGIGRWILIAYRASTTHAERTSKRLDAQLNYWAKGAILTSTFAIYYFLRPHSYAVLEPILPEAGPDDYPYV
ncbi:hypothetical protein FPV67DRAFT_247268 [Lyophyllum atratum]|nr:hypothetical protein FPV67DRAFT_247268 [Lyophyllum atratum]